MKNRTTSEHLRFDKKKAFQVSCWILGMSLSFFSIGLMTGCSVEATSEDPAATPEEESKEETTEDAEGETEETEEETGSGSEDDDEDDSSTDETTETESEDDDSTIATNLPSNGRTISVSDLNLLSIPSGGGSVIGVTSNGGGIRKAASPLAASYDLPEPSAGQLFSLIDALHWHVGAEGVRILKAAYTETAMAAVTAASFPSNSGVDDQSTVIAAHPEVLVLKEGTTDIAFFKADGTVMNTTLPTELGNAISAGPIKDGDGFWVMSTTQLAYFAPASGQTTYEWSAPIAITLELPDNETVKSIYMTVSLEVGQDNNMAASFGSAYYLLTGEGIYTRTLQNASAGGSAAEVGSN